MRLAAVSWRIEASGTVDGFFEHARRIVESCLPCDVVVFPELPSLELLSLEPDLMASDQPRYLADLLGPHFDRFGEIAHDRGCLLVAGSHFVWEGEAVVNSAVVAMPDGSVTVDVPKVNLTSYERDEWRIQPGNGLRRLPDPRLGVTVCYDCEFPESGRALAESGALVQCVPSFTETEHGHQRVRTCCRARAVENQVFVAHAALVGSLGREPVPTTFGTSAILAPSVHPFPADGIVLETPAGEEGAAIADLDFDLLARVRTTGDVRNWQDRRKSDWVLGDPTWIERPTP